MKTAFVFPGQGSQHAGMGADVAQQHQAARRTFDAIDEALGFSLSQLCFEGPEDELRLTENTQPAILATSSAMYAVIRDAGIRPDMVAGHSLGEYSAVVAAGGLGPAAAAGVVRQRGRFMQEAVPVGEGAMAAILGPDLDEIRDICASASEGDVVAPANVNAPGQIVVAGTRAAVERAIVIAKERGVRRALPLPVSAPFHCELMKPAEERLTPVLRSSGVADLTVPLVCNVDAREIRSSGDVVDALIRQVVSPVQWVGCVRTMVDAGIERFVEIGPGAVLTGLIKRIAPDANLINVKDAASLDAYLTMAAGEN